MEMLYMPVCAGNSERSSIRGSLWEGANFTAIHDPIVACSSIVRPIERHNRQSRIEAHFHAEYRGALQRLQNGLLSNSIFAVAALSLLIQSCRAQLLTHRPVDASPTYSNVNGGIKHIRHGRSPRPFSNKNGVSMPYEREYGSTGYLNGDFNRTGNP